MGISIILYPKKYFANSKSNVFGALFPFWLDGHGLLNPFRSFHTSTHNGNQFVVGFLDLLPLSLPSLLLYKKMYTQGYGR